MSRQTTSSSCWASWPKRAAAPGPGRRRGPRARSLKNETRAPLEWLLHNYLFFRAAAGAAAALAGSTAPYLAWLQTRATAVVIALLTLLGLYLVSRQWDSFTHTFVDHMTWSGVLGYALALVLAKTVHELGHAYAATRHGVRVAHMGVAFLVMFPMLYTDTGESWRLKDPKHRLSIASAGIVVELALAGPGHAGLGLAPDGPCATACSFWPPPAGCSRWRSMPARSCASTAISS
jgi:putative peptide zinc metalloprotease protein